MNVALAHDGNAWNVYGMIGLRTLSPQRMELYASRFPLDVLKPYLLEAYSEAVATIVLYEDNPEAFHETGIFSFDASEPETFNYDAFQAPLIEVLDERLALCTVRNLFVHLDSLQESYPLEDDPFHNLVFSISMAPPSPPMLQEWRRHRDRHLRESLFDVQSSAHFQLFPNEVCVVYSHNNYFTSVTATQEDIILNVFEDIVERQLQPVTTTPIRPQLVADLYGHHLKPYGTIRFKTERIHRRAAWPQPFLLLTYPGTSNLWRKRLSRIFLGEDGTPQTVEGPTWMSRLIYNLVYSDFLLLPMVLVVGLMLFLVLATR